MLDPEHRIEVMRRVEHHDLAAPRRALAIAELLHQQPILQLKPRQHRTGWDVSGLENELAHPQGHSKGDQHTAPEGPGAFAFRVGVRGGGPIGGCRVVWGLG